MLLLYPDALPRSDLTYLHSLVFLRKINEFFFSFLFILCHDTEIIDIGAHRHEIGLVSPEVTPETAKVFPEYMNKTIAYHPVGQKELCHFCEARIDLILI